MIFGHVPELILLLVVLVLIFGPGKLPSLGSAIGKSIRGFKQETAGLHSGSQEKVLPESERPSQG
ncbi:MAG: twin-arginine translocase TatA/TatE family subunit [Chloroflexota bacterium]